MPVCYATRDPRDGTLWASLDHGHWGPKLSRSRDGGESWDDISSLKYPEGARHIAQVLPTPDFDPEAPLGQRDYADATVYKIWHLAFGGPKQAGRTAWVVPGRSDAQRITLNGALFVARTEDGGHSWQALRNGLPQENAHDIVLRHALDASGDYLCFGSTTGNVYLSEDRGNHWQSLGHHFPPVYSVRFG